MELIFLGGIIMKKGFVIATVAMSLGIIAPLSQVVTSTPVSAKTTSHSYVTTTSNSISVTNIRKGSTVVLKNNMGQTIATKTAANAGTVTFNLGTQQVNRLTKTDTLAIKLSSGYKFNISFNFINYRTPASNKFVAGIPTELQGHWQAKLGYFTGHWNMTSNRSTLTVNDPQILNNVQYKNLGNHTYVLKGTESYYSNGSTIQYTVKKVSNNHLTLTTANGVSQWYK